MWNGSFANKYPLNFIGVACCITIVLLTACGGGGNVPSATGPGAAPTATGQDAVPPATGQDAAPSAAEEDAAARVQAQSFVTYTRADTYESIAQPDVLVPMRDGFRLTCDLHRPGANGVPAEGRFPSLLVDYTAYGRKGVSPAFVKKGYAVLVCNTRGAQGTGGRSPAPQSIAPVDMFSAQEMRDGYDVIEWVAAQDWSTGKVGMIGFSYGGITALGVAGLAPPHLAAIVPIMGVHDQYQWAYPGGISDVRGGNVLPVIAGCSNAAGEPTCSARMTAAFTSHPTFDEYWERRTVDLAAIKVPTLNVQGFMDFMWVSYEVRNAVIGDEPNFATVIGPWGHGISGSPEVNNMYLAWFDRWVADMPDVPKAPKATVKGTPGQDWAGFAAWPPKSSEPKTLYFDSTGLEQNAPSGGTLQYAIDANGDTMGLTLATTFSSATTLAGPVDISLPITLTATDANVVAKVYARRNGELIDLGWAGYKKASHIESDAAPSPRVPGRTYILKLRIPSKFYDFQPGDSMVLSVASSDKNVASDSPAGTVTVELGQDAYVRAPMMAAH